MKAVGLISFNGGSQKGTPPTYHLLGRRHNKVAVRPQEGAHNLQNQEERHLHGIIQILAERIKNAVLARLGVTRRSKASEPCSAQQRI